MCSSQRGELTNKILGVKGLNRVFLIGTLGNVQRTVLRICVLMLGSKGSRRLGIWQLLFLVTSHSHHFFQVSASVCWNPFILLVGEMHRASKRSHFRTQLNGLGETLGESVRFPVLLLWGFLHLSGEVVKRPTQ